MDAAIVTIGFGEPSEPDRETVETYLGRIFLENMAIEGDLDEGAARARAAELAARRAPGLVAEYEAIGGSPLYEQLVAHADRLEDELEGRGLRARTYVATQYLDPTIEATMAEVAAAAFDRVVVLPMYPLCGPSTTVKAIARAADAISGHDRWDPDVTYVGGWHRHPGYNRVRADNVIEVLDERGLSVTDDDIALVFSAHGTPTSYLDAGSRYDQYVTEYCRTQAALIGAETYHLGYQNHASRGVEWTEPEVEDVVEAVDADRLVVEPVSFIHEQSETLSELDIELAEDAEAAGKELIRVPIPHDDARLAA
ncbi:MAG: ferrochelatase, partial [Halobacteriota archaeon]